MDFLFVNKIITVQINYMRFGMIKVGDEVISLVAVGSKLTCGKIYKVIRVLGHWGVDYLEVDGNTGLVEAPMDHFQELPSLIEPVYYATFCSHSWGFKEVDLAFYAIRKCLQCGKDVAKLSGGRWRDL